MQAGPHRAVPGQIRQASQRQELTSPIGLQGHSLAEQGFIDQVQAFIMSGPLQAGATTMPSADFSYPLPSCYLPDSPLWWTGCEISPDKSVNCPCTTASFTVFPGSAMGPPEEDAHLPQELGLNISVEIGRAHV